MLAVSRALPSPARLVLLDEPGQGMPAAVAARTHELLGGLAATVVVAEQSLRPALRPRRRWCTNSVAATWCSAASPPRWGRRWRPGPARGSAGRGRARQTCRRWPGRMTSGSPPMTSRLAS
ncbi:hypothetical protein ACHZ98_02360 [Streptomyces sp. MAR4 CNY-716]